MKAKTLAASLLTGIVLLTTESYATAQSNKFNKGDLIVNLDYGLGSFTNNDFGWDGSGSRFQNSIGLTADYGILGDIINSKGVITAGLQIGFGFGSETLSFYDEELSMLKYDQDYRRIRIATRGALHYQFIPQLDTYAGFYLAFVNINKWKSDGYGTGSWDDSKTRFIYPALFAGIRYMLTDNFGLNSEISWDDFAYFALGVSFKL